MRKIRIIYFCLIGIFCNSLFLVKSQSQIIILGDLLISHNVVPGGIYKSSIQIKNAFNVSKKLKVYQTEYRSDCDLGQQYPINADNTNFHSNRNWIRFSPGYLTIPPNGVSRVNLEVDVPTDSLLTGSYISMIMVEEDVDDVFLTAKGEDLPSITPRKKNDKKGEKVEIRTIQNIRYAFQIISNMEEKPANANISIKNIKLFKSQDNHRILQFDAENNGLRLIKPEAYAELFNSTSGFKINNEGKDKFFSRKMTLAPNCSARFLIDLGILTYGLYKIQIIIDGGGEDIWGQQFNIKIN
jgi:hypothetical protein